MNKVIFKSEELTKKLDPCPFCAGEAEVVFYTDRIDIDEDTQTHIPIVEIRCTKCPAKMSIPDTLINEWNNRTKFDRRLKRK